MTSVKGLAIPQVPEKLNTSVLQLCGILNLGWLNYSTKSKRMNLLTDKTRHCSRRRMDGYIVYLRIVWIGN